jgi:hypothetical protein
MIQRDTTVKVRLNGAEIRLLKILAERTGLSQSQILRTILHYEGTAAGHALMRAIEDKEVKDLAHQLAKLGNLLNQAIRIGDYLRSNGETKMGEDFAALIVSAGQLVDELRQEFLEKKETTNA